jgi:hypothetical protein
VRGKWNGSAISDQATRQSGLWFHLKAGMNEPLNESHGTILSEHEIAPQGIYDHEYDLVERRMRFDSFLSLFAILPICKSRQYRLVGKEASCEDQNRNRKKEVRNSKTGHAQAVRGSHFSE